jgi:hypothetical protein
MRDKYHAYIAVLRRPRMLQMLLAHLDDLLFQPRPDQLLRPYLKGFGRSPANKGLCACRELSFRLILRIDDGLDAMLRQIRCDGFLQVEGEASECVVITLTAPSAQALSRWAVQCFPVSAYLEAVDEAQ